MPNDAKLGLICGLAAVIGVAVVFFRHDLHSPMVEATAAVAAPQTVPAKKTIRPADTAKAKSTGSGGLESEGNEKDRRSWEGSQDMAKIAAVPPSSKSPVPKQDGSRKSPSPSEQLSSPYNQQR
jgi:hypothetical protein